MINHDCESCLTCGVHDGISMKCCGCYDGVCCADMDQPNRVQCDHDGGRTSWHDYADAILARFDVTPKTTEQPDGGTR